MHLHYWVESTIKKLSLTTETAKLDIAFLIEHHMGLNLTQQRIYNPELEPQLLALLNEQAARLMNGEPLAYIIGNQPFYDINLIVTPATLIPRPDTECLVEAALARIEETATLTIADLGTGSGAIAIVIAKHRPKSTIIATDKNIDALRVAKNNAKMNAVAENIHFLHADWLTPIVPNSLDIIISNPPYIAGETGQLIARYLKDLDLKRIIIANRTLGRAQLLAEEIGGYAISLAQVNEHLHEADMVFGAARADELLLIRNQVQRSLKKRRNKFQVFIDLAIPRIFESDIETLGNAFLYSVDDLEQIIDHNRENRMKAAKQAEVMLNLYSDDYIGWLHSKPQQQLIRQIREHANATRQELLADAYRRLAHGEDPAIIMEQLSYKLTNKLLHSPSAMIHAIPPNHKDWLAIVADTFETDKHQ